MKNQDNIVEKLIAGQRAEKAEAMVERMIEAGNRLYELAEELDDLVDEFRAYPDLVSWRTLVAEWKERE
jgi:methionine aminopeptidase